MACRAALEERTRDRVPIAWTQAQNNLGNALTVLGNRRVAGVGQFRSAPGPSG